MTGNLGASLGALISRHTLPVLLANLRWVRSVLSDSHTEDVALTNAVWLTLADGHVMALVVAKGNDPEMQAAVTMAMRALIHTRSIDPALADASLVAWAVALGLYKFNESKQIPKRPESQKLLTLHSLQEMKKLRELRRHLESIHRPSAITFSARRTVEFIQHMGIMRRIFTSQSDQDNILCALKSDIIQIRIIVTELLHTLDRFELTQNSAMRGGEPFRIFLDRNSGHP